MTIYLSMNGTSDYLQLPSMTIKKIVFDAIFPTQADLKMIFDARSGMSIGYVYARSDGTITSAGANFGVTGYARDTRVTATFTAQNNTDVNGNFTDNVTVFANNTGGENFRGSIYSIKCYNANNTLIAYYDMSTRTVQDLSGNGNHATLNGGTWIGNNVLVSDSFNRADNLTTLGNTDNFAGGKVTTWKYFANSVFGILNNGAVPYSDLNPKSSVAYVDTGKSDVKITVIADKSYDWVYFLCAFRINPTDNSFLFLDGGSGGNIAVRWYNGTSYSDLLTISNNSPIAGDIFQVVMKGSTIDVYRNANKIGTVTTINNLYQTNHGLANQSAQDGSLWKDIIIEDSSPILVSDSFNRANTTLSATGLGSTDTGQTWVQVRQSNDAVVGINNNTAKMTGSDVGVVVNAGTNNVIVKTTVLDPTGNPQLIFRADENAGRDIIPQNTYMFVEYNGTSIAMYKFNGGWTNIGTNYNVSLTSSFELRVELQDTSIKVYLNNTLIITATDSFNQYKTYFGLGSGNDNGVFDNFIVTSTATCLVSDSFNRSTNSTSLEFTDSSFTGTEKVWQVLPSSGGSIYGVDANGRAYASVTSGTRTTAVIDAGVSDAIIEATFYGLDGINEKPKLALRTVDANNSIYLAITTGSNKSWLELLYYNAGAYNSVWTSVNAGYWVSNGDTVKVSVIGSSYTVFINEIQIDVPQTITFNQNATKFGINSYNYPNSRFDNFKVKAISSYPVCTIISTSKTKISDEANMNQSIITFKFDKDVIQWIAKLNGNDQTTGTTVDSGTTLNANTNATCTVDWNEGLSEGINRINIYGKASDGTWTVYNS
jgi:hypothetical protein